MHILAWSGCCLTLTYWQTCHIQDFISVYLDIFRHIQACSMMIVTITLTLIFTKFKKTYDFSSQWRQFRGSTESIEIIRDLWKQRYNRISKLTPFWGNKLYGRKESFLTKYYCIRSKLTVFQKFLTFSFKAISIIGQMRTFFRQRIPWSSYAERKCRHRHPNNIYEWWQKLCNLLQ